MHPQPERQEAGGDHSLPRGPRTVPGRARRKKILKAAKGGYSGRSKLFKTALQTDGNRADDVLKRQVAPQITAAGGRYLRIAPNAIPKPGEARALVCGVQG